MNHGTLIITGKGEYLLTTLPHVRQTVRRVLPGAVIRKDGTIKIARTPETTESLDWILSRWEHETQTGLRAAMKARVTDNRWQQDEAHRILSGRIEAPQPPDWNPSYPLRDYQKQAVALSRIVRGGFLLGDDVGLGKTATAIGIIAANPGSSLVVCGTTLQRQWYEQIKMFCPSLRVHTIQKNAEYVLPLHDVTICSYTKLASWVGRRNWQTVIYDEIQELRHDGTKKSDAAQELALTADLRVGLSATPVYNYAGEIYNVMECLAPGRLGNVAEFASEWGADIHNKLRVNDPEELGSWLRSQNLYLRRHRKDVGRELPPLTKINHIVEHDPKILERLRAQCNELAERVFNGGFHQRGQSARQLDILLRQTTGIAKAPFVADFVKVLVESGEQVLLGGWHREVYGIWDREFTREKIHFSMFTGSENSKQKEDAKRDFISGASRVMMMSLRSGAGLDGLQTASRTVVIGELDWSPQVIHQLVGRLRRDGQPDPVTVFTMVADAGADPIMSSVLAEKWEQGVGLTDPDSLTLEPQTGEEDSRLVGLARSWLASQGIKR